MRGITRMINQMVKELILGLMGKSMKGNLKRGNQMVKVQKLSLMEESMKGNSRIINIGTERDITKMGKS